MLREIQPAESPYSFNVLVVLEKAIGVPLFGKLIFQKTIS